MLYKFGILHTAYVHKNRAIKIFSILIQDIPLIQIEWTVSNFPLKGYNIIPTCQFDVVLRNIFRQF